LLELAAAQNRACSRFGDRTPSLFVKIAPGTSRAVEPVSGAEILKARGGFPVSRYAISVASDGGTRLQPAY